jgi:hypothetical protein
MRVLSRALLSAFSLLIAANVQLAQGQSSPSGKSQAAFKQLTSVVGDWEGVDEGVPFRVSYTLSGNATALMETVKPGDPTAMITMFTVDGDHLVATHYCVVGNQPQMVSGVPGDLHEGVKFSLARITGMKTPDAWHNTGLTLVVDDNDHMTQRWTYLYKGKPGSTVFHYTRKK